uniref:DnaJ homolog subfamily B member 9 n=1 Tax=Oryzias latipes TaxID=8090 RepID=A0A3P9JE55_ORYLA
MAAFQVYIVLLLLLVEASGMVKNYYDILKVEKTATESQIKKAFRRLALRFHPDKNRSADAEKVFREMTEASDHKTEAQSQICASLQVQLVKHAF